MTPPSLAQELWWDFHLAVINPGQIPNSLLVTCYHLSLSSSTSLFASIGCELNRDGTPADPILFHLERVLIAAFKELDFSVILSTYINIIKRHGKINRPTEETSDSFAARWSTWKW